MNMEQNNDDNVNTTTENNGPDPQTNLRADLWHEMTLGELGHQLELVYEKLALFHTLDNGNPSVITMKLSLESALTTLNGLIDTVSERQK